MNEKQAIARAKWMTAFPIGTKHAPAPTVRGREKAPTRSWWADFAAPGSSRSGFNAQVQARHEERMIVAQNSDRGLGKAV